jgi:hypothetical protein
MTYLSTRGPGDRTNVSSSFTAQIWYFTPRPHKHHQPLHTMDRELGAVEAAVNQRLAKVFSGKNDLQAQLIASVARETVEEAVGDGSAAARSRESWAEALDQAVLDFEVSVSAEQLNAILNDLEEDGVLDNGNDSVDTEFEDESNPAKLVGKAVLALMTVFDSETKTEVKEWESGVVKEVEAGDEYGLGMKLHVLFDKFAALQVVSVEDVCLDYFDDEEGESKTGVCPFCERHMPLTFHHLIPRCTHTVMKKKYDLDSRTLNHGVDLCRPCHSAVHRTESNRELAENFNTTEKLLGHPAIQKWIGYAKKQKCEGGGQDRLRLRR